MSSIEHSRGDQVIRVLGVVCTAVVGIPFVLFVWLALTARFGVGSADPHGYGMIFGTVLALVAGIVLALVVPLVFPRGRRSRASAWSMLAYLVVAAVLIVALLTA